MAWFQKYPGRFPMVHVKGLKRIPPDAAKWATAPPIKELLPDVTDVRARSDRLGPHLLAREGSGDRALLRRARSAGGAVRQSGGEREVSGRAAVLAAPGTGRNRLARRADSQEVREIRDQRGFCFDFLNPDLLNSCLD